MCIHAVNELIHSTLRRFALEPPNGMYFITHLIIPCRFGCGTRSFSREWAWLICIHVSQDAVCARVVNLFSLTVLHIVVLQSFRLIFVLIWICKLNINHDFSFDRQVTTLKEFALCLKWCNSLRFSFRRRFCDF